MLINKAFNFRIYPNKTQKTLINKTIGCCRFVFNHFLNAENDMYKNNNAHISYVSCAKQLTQLKKQEETSWLKEVDATALQSALRNLDSAYQNFFKKRADRPRFKSKKNKVQSYITKNNNGAIAITGSKMKLPKLGVVRFAKSREIDGRILNATIRRNPSGKYFISILCECEKSNPLPKTASNIGIDLGLSTFAVSDTGSVIINPKEFQKLEGKLAKAQRILSRRVKGSNNWHKQRIKVARIHEQISNRRTDFLQKESTKLIKNHDVICLETLAVKSMLQEKKIHETNHEKRKRAKSIADTSWSRFVSMLVYKSDWYGKTIINIDQYFASTQICSCCGEKTGPKNDMKIRDWVCSCGAQHNRDHNAAINIKREGLRLLNAETVGTTGIA